MDYKQLRECVVEKVLDLMREHIPVSLEATDLLMMTAAHESAKGRWVKQLQGPALGIYQMEPETHKDVWENYLLYRKPLGDLVKSFAIEGKPAAWQLVANLYYATAMARVNYWRVKEKIPEKELYVDNVQYHMALARYAKKYWNTSEGKASWTNYYEDYVLWRK